MGARGKATAAADYLTMGESREGGIGGVGV